MIDGYKYGRIIINNKIYDYDVEVRWAGEVLPWQRAKNHIIDVEDIEMALEQKPEVIVIGTGEDGNAEVMPDVVEILQTRGIKIFIDKTEEATKTFNIRNEDSLEEEGRQEKIIGLFHITC